MANSDRPFHGDHPAAIADQAVSDQKELAVTAFQRTRMPMVVTNACHPEHPIILANEAFLTLTGYSPAEVLGRNCRFLQGPGTSAAAIAEIRAALLEDRKITVELLNYRKDGSEFWNQLHVSPIHDDNGRLSYHFGSQLDRTEYRKISSLEASEHRLLLEVDHRANNALALVDSIVRLTKCSDASLYAAAVQSRVQALSRAHNLLAQFRWHETPLIETIRTQIEPYGLSRVRMLGPNIMLAPRAVQPLALFIHELAVNAESHGALSRSSGRLQLSWKHDSENNGFSLCWEEIGGPSPTTPRTPGFGTVVGDATIRRQLQGATHREWSDQGLKVTITVPNVIDHIEEAGRHNEHPIF